MAHVPSATPQLNADQIAQISARVMYNNGAVSNAEALALCEMARASLRSEIGAKGPDWNAHEQEKVLASPPGTLTKPAQVGGTRFGVGISERTVIERAQREYEYQTTPEKEAERMTRFRSFVQTVGNISNEDTPIDVVSASAPMGWREALRQVRVNLDAGGWSTSNRDFLQEHGGALLDKVEEALESLAPSSSSAAMEPSHVPVPRDMLERMRPALKLYVTKAAQAVLSCKWGDLPAHYLETLQKDELAQDALLCALDDLLSVERHAVTISTPSATAEPISDVLAVIFCNMDANGDPVGAQPEPGWEEGYAAGLRYVYRRLKSSGIPLPSVSEMDRTSA